MKTILSLTLSLLFYFTVPVYTEATQEEQGITAEQWLYMGDKDLAQHHYTEAILDYSKAIELNPGYASAYVNRGNAYFLKNNLMQRSMTTPKQLHWPLVVLSSITIGELLILKKDYLIWPWPILTKKSSCNQALLMVI